MSKIRVLVNGALGKMGSETCLAVEESPDMEVVAKCDLGDDLAQSLRAGGAEVAVDFTHPSAGRKNAETILSAGVHAVIGTTGFKPEDLEPLRRLAEENNRGILIAPNFAVGVILMIRFAEEAVKYFPSVEIIELHHDRKADAPSGTAVATAERLVRARTEAPPERPPEKITLEGARGGNLDGIPIHSVRLPGLLAHQEVLFGLPGQVLTIRHDTLDRKAFMPGVLLAIRKIRDKKGLIYGLDELL
jgi:4-hydroxy-tetrahydrodipicolinate reductase